MRAAGCSGAALPLFFSPAHRQHEPAVHPDVPARAEELRQAALEFGAQEREAGDFGIGPIAAVPKALQYAGMSLSDIDLIELNEAFAAQGLAVMRELDFDEEITNVNGGAIALGHPLGCTGAKLTVQLLHELERQDKRVGLVTMCIGGGMGAAGVFEVL